MLLRESNADGAWCERLRTSVADEVLALGVPGLAVNVRDDAVAGALIAMNTLDPPVAAVVSVWTEQYYGRQVTATLELLRAQCAEPAAYLVTESAPLRPPPAEPGRRTTGLANVALLRRPAGLDEPTWRQHWHVDHTPVAIETQSTFGYTQNTVVRALTAGAPEIAGIVEELFPIEAVTDLKAFFGAADDADLGDRLNRMLASTSRFGANENIDTIPTSRYVLREPFTAGT